MRAQTQRAPPAMPLRVLSSKASFNLESVQQKETQLVPETFARIAIRVILQATSFGVTKTSPTQHELCFRGMAFAASTHLE
jgi:hypothetical protein